VKRIRIGVVGAGHLGKIHARILARMPQFQLIGIVDPYEPARQEVAAQHGTAPFTSHEELVGRVDAAVIAAPTGLHHAIGLDLMRAGIHLLMEKPLAPTLIEADELVETARRSRVVLQVGHVERFNPVFAAALPHLGQPIYIEAVRSGPFSVRSTDTGAVLDLMIHDIDLVLALVDAPLRRVEATGLPLFSRHEDVANARLTFDNGVVASLTASRASSTSVRTMQIWSADCLATLDFAQHRGQLAKPSIALRQREIDVSRLSLDEKRAFKENLADYLPVETIEVQPADAITAELEDFERSIHTGSLPRVSGEAGRNAVAVAEDILARLHTPSIIAAPEIDTPVLDAPASSVIPAPHWTLRAARASVLRREVG
jgi:predicted dehydrogenase